MSGFLKFSDAASLALHSAAFLAGKDNDLASTGEIAAALWLSQAHLSKVLQRLTKAGIVESVRGPGGGYELARPAREISLKDIYEAVEGPLDASSCPFDIPACRSGSCVLGGEFVRKGKELVKHLADTPLSSLRLALKGKLEHGRRRSRAPKRAGLAKAMARAGRRTAARSESARSLAGGRDR